MSLVTTYPEPRRSRPGWRRRRARPDPRRWLLAITVSAFVLAFLVAAVVVLEGAARRIADTAAAQAVQAEAERSTMPAEMAAFYSERGFRPLWIQRSTAWPFSTRLTLRPDADVIVAAVGRSPALSADRMRAEAALRAARAGGAADAARAELALSAALVDYVRALRTPGGQALAFIDPDLPSGRDARSILQQAAQSPSLGDFLRSAEQINPVYHALHERLAAYRARWSRLPRIAIGDGPALGVGDGGARVELLRRRLGLAAGAGPFDAVLEAAVRDFQAWHGLPVTGVADPATVAALNRGPASYERLIALNLERAKAFPPVAGRRFILVNVPAGQLYFYHDGQVRGAMPVAVGARAEPTPMMAGLLRYVVLNPYWDVPVDLVRDRLAPQVLRNGPAYFQAKHMQALSDWTDHATLLDPRQIDWKAVADGRQELRVRQQPGGDNMMGRVMFMLPNELGIYLHDTPDRTVFQNDDRSVSSGCIRLFDAAMLMTWLFGDQSPRPAAAGADQSVALSEPTPVYITYMTAAATPTGLAFYPDIYGRDAAAR